MADPWRRFPVWWTRHGGWMDLSLGAHRLLCGLLVELDGGGEMPAELDDLRRTVGVQEKEVRVRKWLDELVRAGYVTVDDGFIRLVGSRREAGARRAPCRQVEGTVPATDGHGAGTVPAARPASAGTVPNEQSEIPAVATPIERTDRQTIQEQTEARGFALAPPPVEPEKRKAKKAKDPPKPPEPVVVPEHMRPLEEYQRNAMARKVGKSKVTLESVIEWALATEQKRGRPISWERLIGKIAVHEEANKPYVNIKQACVTFLGNEVAFGENYDLDAPAPQGRWQRGGGNGNGYVPPRPNPNVRAYNPVMTDNCIVSTPESAARWLAGEAERKARGEDF